MKAATANKSKPSAGAITALPLDVKLIRMLTCLTEETHAELVARLLRGPVCKELRAKGQDPDRVIAEYGAAK
jgi:hypothetical protein